MSNILKLKWGNCCGTCKHSDQHNKAWSGDYYFQYCTILKSHVPNQRICDEFDKFKFMEGD